MFSPLPTPKEMAAWDAAAINGLGIRQEVLMENASRAALAVLLELTGNPACKRVALLAGPGGNGGDALALARPLYDLGADVEIWLAAPAAKFKGASRYNYNLARKYGIKIKNLRPGAKLEIEKFEIVIDGLYGTGFRGPLSDDGLRLINQINSRPESSFCLSLDIPSGLDGLSGQPSPQAVRAEATVCFEAAKCGLAEPAALAYVGELFVREIGIPSQVKDAAPASRALITREILRELPLPDPDLHKGSAGRVLVIGGSPGLTGAPLLAALGAMRAGAGLVSIACPGGLEAMIKAGRPEIMTIGLGGGLAWSPQIIGPIRENLSRCDAIVIGPGLGRTREAGLLVESLLELDVPSVWDADALFALAERPKLLKRMPKNAILTPHPGEMAKLCGVGVPELAADRAGYALKLSEKSGACVALKGAHTLIAKADEPCPVCVCPISAPNLAVGGAGDVLSGVLASLLARKLSLLPATALGVYWHGLAGLKLGEQFPYRGNLAGEIAETLPYVLKEYLDEDCG